MNTTWDTAQQLIPCDDMTIVQECGLWLERGLEVFNLGREKDDSAMFTVPVVARHRGRPTNNREPYKIRMKACLKHFNSRLSIDRVYLRVTIYSLTLKFASIARN